MQIPSFFFANILKQFQFLFLLKIPHLTLMQVTFIRGEFQNITKITRPHQQCPLVKKTSTAEWEYLSGQS